MEYMIAAHMRKSQARPMSMPRPATPAPRNVPAREASGGLCAASGLTSHHETADLT
jgi:hypothetical protein